MSLVLHLRIAGALLILLALAHCHIARLYRWEEEAARLSPFNRQVLLVHAFFIALTVALMGALALFWPRELATRSALGLPISAGLTLFWAIRLYFQWFVYDRSLWAGKRFETLIHFAFTAMWIYLTGLFALCLRVQLA